MSAMNMNRILAVVVGMIVMSLTALSQQANLNLEGFVRDEVTGAPVGAKMFIFTPSDKRISINSNSKDGSYLQTLVESGPHKVVITGYNVYRKEEVVDIPVSEKFKIIKRDFTVKALVQGSEILSTSSVFAKNTASLTDQGIKTISDLSALLKTNQAMNIVLHITPDEDRVAAARAANEASYKKAHDEWAKATKKLKKGQTPAPEPVRQADIEDPNKGLVQQRIDTLKARLRPVKNGDVRIKYVYEPLSVQQVQEVVPAVAEAPAKGSKKKGKAKATPAATTTKTTKVVAMPQLVARIGIVKDLMD